MLERRQDPVLPPLAFGYIVQWWERIGPVSYNAMGEAPLSFSEIEAFAQLMRITIDPWEAQAIHDMSSAYLSQKHKATKLDCPAPYIVGYDTEDNRTRVSKQIAAAFRNLKAAPRGAMKKR